MLAGTMNNPPPCYHRLMNTLKRAAFAAFAAGALRTNFGSYAPAFLGAGALCLIAALAVLPIARGRGTLATAQAA